MHCALMWNHFQINYQDRTEVSLIIIGSFSLYSESFKLPHKMKTIQIILWKPGLCSLQGTTHKFWIKNINSWTKAPCVVVEWIYAKIQVHYVKREECMNLHIGGRWISKHGRQYWKEGKMKVQTLLHLDSYWR